MATVYAYDVLDNLTNVTQGSQQRNFVYDSLGELTSAATPEAGTVNYSYTPFGLLATRTDARNVQAAYQYDTLNRLLGISYLLNGSAWPTMPNVCTPSGGTPSNVCLAYGTSSASNNNGRVMQMTDPTGNAAYQYDALGRVTTLSKTVGSTVYPIQYAYDIAGNPKTVTYPSGRALQESFDSLERVTQISSSGTNYLSSMAYNSAWRPTGFSYGNGVAATFGYNSRMQLASLAYTKSGSTLFILNYDYTTGVPGNNGQIQKITDNVDATRTSTIVYDAWLRLKSWTNSQATVTETYDRYGNRLTQSLPVPSTVAVDVTTNHITTTGYAYDAAGNMTNDSVNVLTYDGENRVVTSTQSGATYTYAYDGNGLRVMKTPPTGSATVYIFSGPKVIAEYASGAAPGSPTSEYIYSGSQLVATLAGSATTYHHPDHLSTRISTDSNGNTVRSFGHYPFGETWYETGAASKWKFTSYERDSESLNDYAIARSYRNLAARFSSPDPLAGSIADPQSLNRYSYGLNDPTNLVDPLGLCPPGTICIDAWGYPWPDGLGGGGGSGGVRYRILQMLTEDGGGGGGKVKQAVKALVCTATAPLVQMAQMNGGATGIGVGGSAGLGVILGGLALQGGVQAVADPNGNVGLAFSGGYNPGFGVLGAGALGGIQYTRSTGRTIFDLRGSATSGGVSGAISGVGAGLDVAGSKSADSVTLTTGLGIGGKGAAFTRTGTAVPGWLSIDCGPK
jgi:RHS repeat-associated protein